MKKHHGSRHQPEQVARRSRRRLLDKIVRRKAFEGKKVQVVDAKLTKRHDHLQSLLDDAADEELRQTLEYDQR